MVPHALRRLARCAILSALAAALCAAAAPYRQQSLTFRSEGISLAATLYLPSAAAAPFPAMVIVHGSGDFPRRRYHRWADHWARLGYAVLVYDKRGCGDSEGVYVASGNGTAENLDLLARDAAAALETLRSRSDVKGDDVGFWGVSQAGWIVPRAAAISGHAAFMILVSGPAVTVGEEIDYSVLTGDGLYASRDFVTRAERKLEAFPPHGFDPIPDLRRLEIPGLWLQGALDASVPANKSARVIEDLKRDGKPYDVQVFRNAGHGIFVPRVPAQLGPTLASGFWEVQEHWLERRGLLPAYAFEHAGHR